MLPSNSMCSNVNPPYFSNYDHEQMISSYNFPPSSLSSINNIPYYYYKIDDFQDLFSRVEYQEKDDDDHHQLKTTLLTTSTTFEAQMNNNNNNNMVKNNNGGRKRDRHSKIETAQGTRDRRMRLSLDIARQFFGLQDILGFDKASQTVEWLLSKAKSDINKLSCPTSSSSSFNNRIDQQNISITTTSKCVNKVRKPRPFGARESREKARERARERTKVKMNNIMIVNDDDDAYSNLDITMDFKWTPTSSSSNIFNSLHHNNQMHEFEDGEFNGKQWELYNIQSLL